MLFGIPWPGIVAIVAIVGGLLYAYKEKELEVEAKSRGNSRELHELRKIVHNLKSRIETLEAIAAEEKSQEKEANPLSSIEIEDESERSNAGNTASGNKTKT
ncbi:MAG: hypothetical protein FH748_05880 [Balneolaceae bacterium]|nr:hypothetical protein [Balneolaceae bacterium]